VYRVHMRFDPCKIAPLGSAGACEIASPQSDTCDALGPVAAGSGALR